MKHIKVTLAIILSAILMPMSITAGTFQVAPVTPELYAIEITSHGCENGEHDLVEKLLEPNSTVFDIGANTGDYTSFIIGLNNSSQIYAFEPLPEAFQKLQTRFAASPMVGNLHLYQLGIFNASTTKTIWHCVDIPELSSIYDRQLNDPIKSYNFNYQPIEISTISLDEFCTKHQINLINYLKIDTEGAELDVLHGAEQLLANSQIDYLQFEYGGTYPDAGITLKTVYEYLTGFNYTIYRISRWKLTKIDTWQDWMENYKYGNFLAVRSGKELKV